MLPSSSSSSSTPEPDRRGPPARNGPTRVALVLGGGNALGAYLAGAYETLHEQGVRPDRIVGASIGAVTGAILAGNPPERRLERLREFWAEAALHTFGVPAPAGRRGRQFYNSAHAALTAVVGRPGLFGHRYPGLLSVLPGMPGDVALYDHAPLRRTLERLVDFDRLNRAGTRLTVACTDLETGGDVYFDSAREEIRPEHLLASAAIAPLFPPVEIEGRLLGDPGYANNLPLDPVFDPAPEADLVCVAVDLFGLRSPRPASLDAAVERAQDIVFASAGRRRVEALRREYGLRERFEPAAGPRVRLVHLAYHAAGHELAAKTLDYSSASLRDRWAAGRRDMAAGLTLLEGDAGDRRFECLPVDPRGTGLAPGPAPVPGRAA